MSGHVGDVNLPVFAWLISSEMMQGLVYLEGPLWCGLGLGRKSEPAKYTQKWVGSIEGSGN